MLRFVLLPLCILRRSKHIFMYIVVSVLIICMCTILYLREKVISVPVYSALLGGPILPLRSTSPTQAMVKEEYCLVDDVVENDVLFINNSGSSKKLASGVDLESSYVLSHKSATSEHNQVSRPSSRSHTSNGRKGSSAHGRSSHGQNSRGQSTHSRGHSSHGPPGGELDELISVSVPTDKSSDVDGSELSSRPSSVSGTNSRPNSNCDRPSGSPCHRHAPQTFVDCNNNDRGSPQSTRESTKKGNRGSSRKNEAHLGTREERLAKILTKHELIIWDKEDRGQVLQHAEEMCALSSTLLSESQSITIAADEVTATAQAHKAKEADLLSVILRNEDKATTTAVDNEFKYVSSFKVHAADNLIGVLAKVYREVTLKMIKSETRRYFRALRGPLSEKLSVAMFNRKKISNWLRLCNRLTSINKRIPLLRKLRSMWVIFNRWLKLVEIETLNVSPGLVAIVRRRCELLPRYSQMLAAKGIKDVVYVNSKHLAAATSEFSALFLRWQMCVQEKGLFRILKVKAAQLFRLKLMSKVFFALRYHMRHEDTQCLRQFNVGFPIIRLQTDMDQVCKRFCALRRFGLQHIVGSYNRKFIACQAVDAKNALSFKRFLAKLKSDVASRLTIEQRVLSESFDSRGMQEFLDVRATKNLPNSMSRIDGKRFSDPYISGDDQARGCWVPGGYKLSTIRLNMQENMGIVGWQLAWSADSAKEINSPRRGKWMGAAMTVHEIHIPSDDYLQGVEYLYDGSLIVGLRLRYIWGGWSKWVGGKTSMSTLPLYLHCNMPPVEEFESSYVPAGYDEETCPGMPRSYVIGFTGLTSTTTKASTCLGLVVRKIISQHLFSYSWVQDAVDIQEITRDIDPNEEGTYEELQRNSDNDEDGEDDDLVNWGDADGDASERRDTLKLPPLPTKGLSRGNSTIQNTSRPSARPSARVASSRNSARSSSRVGESGGKRTRKASLAALKRLGKSKVATKLWQSMGSARGDGDEEMSLSDLVVKQVQEAESEDGDSLLNSERQFFDVIRMRITETNAAENRAEQFARRLWSKKEYRESKELSVMTSINILSHLTKWYFQAICRRLSRTCKTESEGTKLLSESQRLAVRAENATKRSELNASAALELESTRQPWMKSIMLSPVERAEKKKYLDDIHSLKAEAKADELLAKELTEESAKMLRRGKELLPRLQLSKYVCNYYRLKILAARHMQSLLQRMDLHTLKNQLSGNSAQGGGFSSLEMDIIRSSLRRREPEPDETETLDDIVNLEVGKQTATMLSKLQNSACRTHLRNQKSLDDSSVAEKLMLNLTGPPELSHSSVGSYGSGIHGSGLNAANSHLSLGSSSGRGLAFELTEAQQLKNQEDAERKEREKAAERERNMLKRSMPPKIVVKHLKKNKHKFGKPKTVALTPPPLSSANGEEGKNIILSKSLTHIPVTTTSATQKAWHSVIASHAVDNDVGVREAAKEIVVDVAIPLPKSTASKGKKVRAITSGDIDDNSTCGSTASDGGASSGTAASTNGARTIRRKKTVTIDA